MDDTRVNRFQEYRQSFIKEGSIVLETPENKKDDRATTSTLPIGEVLSAVEKEDKKVAFIKRKYVLKLLLKIGLAILIIAGLVVLGIFAWRK
ncbi:MAG: hypothetical protein K6C32_03000 [Bacilli bacterium]|nr:hypothetical protein [Bacilli bacterium]